MKKLLTLAIISIFSISCTNTETPQSVNQEVNSNSKTNLQARGEGQEIKDPSKLTTEETQVLINEAIEAIEYFNRNPEAQEFGTQTGRKAVILCHDNYGSEYGNACVYNSSGYLVNVTWQPKRYANGDGIYPDTTVYSGTVVSQCNC